MRGRKNFADFLTECVKCKQSFRADHIIEEQLDVTAEGLDEVKTNEFLTKVNCLKCGGTLGKAFNYNLMFKTMIGPGKDSITGYLRPETAQTTYLGFKRLWEIARKKLPFGVMQLGHSFRNEISPRQGMIRLREFNQAEIQFFVDPEDESSVNLNTVKDLKVKIFDKNEVESEHTIGQAYDKKMIENKWIAYHLAKAYIFFREIGIDESRLRLRQHRENERSFYSSDTWDIEFFSDSFGKIELVGIADRGNYDLSQHIKHSKTDLSVNIEGRKFVPNVVEVAYGIDRPFYCVLESSFQEDEDRTYLSLPNSIAPYRAAIFPLVQKNDIPEKAIEIYDSLRNRQIHVFYDKSGSIGKRYARADEVGIPHSITIDYDTLKDDTITIRERDSKNQRRINIVDLINELL